MNRGAADPQGQFELLSSEAHAHLRVIAQPGAQFGDAVMQVMAFPFEFRNLQSYYPIFFQVDREDQFYPIALLGFEDGENLFLEGDHWDAGYIPAMRRREPFLIGVNGAAGQNAQAGQARMLSIDRSSPRISTTEGERLFSELGVQTEYLDAQADLLEALHDGLSHCQGFARTLKERDLIESVTIDVTLSNGLRSQLIGLSAIDEARVRDLSAQALGELNEQGYLMPLYMVIASMSNVPKLMARKNARLVSG